MSSFQDKYGLYHHIENPRPDSSSNAPVFSAAVLSLRMRLGEDVQKEAKALLRELLNDGYYGNYAYAFQQSADALSHDNWKGIVALTYMAKVPMPIRFSFRSHARPDNFLLWLYIALQQYGFSILGYPFLFLWSLLTFISMARKYKTRHGKKRARAGNKQMIYFLCTAMRLETIFKISTWIIKRNDWFGSWTKVFKRYYIEGHSPAPNHPAIVLSRKVKYHD